MTVNEQGLWLPGDGFNMLGIISLPPAPEPAQRTGVVVVVGGAQYRTGSHRQFTQLARRLAQAGFPVLRFDLPGMGDSPGELPPFEDSAPHIAAAIDGFQRQCPGVERVVLWGLCDGASASLLYLAANQDPRIAGLALLNPWVRNELSLARARVKHYYVQRLREPDFWHKLLRGGVGWQAVAGWMRNVKASRGTGPQRSGFQDRMAGAWLAFNRPILLLLSERDLTAQEFVEHAGSNPSWTGWSSVNTLTTVTLPGADHTCSVPGTSRAAEDAVLRWLPAV